MLIPPKAFELHRIVSGNGFHHCLEGIRVERLAEDRSRAVATNGKILGLVDWKEPDNTEFPSKDGEDYSIRDVRFSGVTIRRDDAKRLSKWKCNLPKPILGYIAMKEAPNPTVEMTDLDSVQKSSPGVIEHEYPDYSGAFNFGTNSMIVNIHELKKVVDFLCSVVPKDTAKTPGRCNPSTLSNPVVVTFDKDGKKPVKFQYKRDDLDVMAMIMPGIVQP